jgi:hypothetical protein
MENEQNMNRPGGIAPRISGRTVLIGVAGAVAAAALLTMARSRHQARRYGDSARERRNPLHFFVAGRHPLRRQIDTSGAHPLFERRQSVYDAY